ncbi:MAG: HEAT repeat domain-containing protein [Cyanobacteria bacterium P01_A01_bin.114]
MSISREQVEVRLGSDNLGDRLTAVNQLRDLTPAVAFELIQTVVSDASARVRYAAISQLAELGKQDKAVGLQILRQALHHDPEADVQAAAADAIGALQLTEAYDDLASVYHQTSEWLVQMSIVACLGELGDPRAFELLKAALVSDNGLVQLSAIGSLGELGDPRALDVLLPYVDHTDWQTRHRLAQALGCYDRAEAKAALKKLAQDASPVVADAAKAHL